MRETEYVFSSARVRAKENTLISRESFFRMAEAKDAREVLAILAECGFATVYGEDGTHADEEATIALLTEDARALLKEAAPDPSLFDFLYYPIDCHNAKSVLKAALSGRSADGLLLAGGTVLPHVILRELSEGRTECLPTHMSEAASAVRELYAKNKDPRETDLLLDRACYRDMAECVKGDEYLSRYLSMRIDMSNFLTYLRIVRRFPGKADNVIMLRASELFKRAFLEGGLVALGDYPPVSEDGVMQLAEKMRVASYAQLFERLNPSEEPIEKIEAQFDLYLLRFFEDVRYVAFGACVLLLYAVKREFETKNLRIIFAGKRASVSPDRIRESLRLI